MENTKYIYLNTFRSEVNLLSSEVKMNHYLIGSKVCYGNFVVYSSPKKFKPIIKSELVDEDLNIKDIVPVINSDGVYLPTYLKNKIGNARKGGKKNLKDTIKLIVDNHDKYYNLFKDEELYKIISAFFDLVYEEVVKLNKGKNLKIEFLRINNVEPLFNKEWNSGLLNSSFYISNTFLKHLVNSEVVLDTFNNLIRGIGTPYTISFNTNELSESQNIRSSFYNIIYTLGLPYIINSELGDTIHLKNDFLSNCYDSFIIIGLLIEMLKKINYPIKTDYYKEILSLTNLPNMRKNDLEKILKDIIMSEYTFISKITSSENKEVIIEFGTDTKKATSINNILDFYYLYFFNHLEDKEFKKDIKQEELTKFKNTLKKSRYRSNSDSYIRQLLQQRLDYEYFKKEH